MVIQKCGENEQTKEQAAWYLAPKPLAIKHTFILLYIHSGGLKLNVADDNWLHEWEKVTLAHA
jgi:hypothetical protein